LGLGIREEEQGQELGIVQVGKSRRAQKGGGGGNMTGTWLLAKRNNVNFVKEQGQVKKVPSRRFQRYFARVFQLLHLYIYGMHFMAEEFRGRGARGLEFTVF
jgi:hypothetical protein